GHYAAIDFNNGIAIADSSHTISRGSCASICDTSGNLLFYAVDDTVALYASTINGAKVFSNNHQLMQNGDSLNAQAWYYEIVIIPYPGSDSLYYVFTIGVTSFYGLYYSIVDLSQNGGLGAVIQKNVQLQTFKQVDCLTAVKHGNGRDWWLLFRKKENAASGSNDKYYEYLITPSGLSSVIIQHVGSLNTTNSGEMEFNSDGSKMMYINEMGLMEYYDFDRCTGIISNPVTIFPEQVSPFTRLFWDGQFSPSGKLFYVTTDNVTNYLVQFNLTSGNIPASADTLWTHTFPTYSTGQLKLASDNKIYLSCNYFDGSSFYYPYADTVYNMYNMNLSVINEPDSLGATCNFQPYSFYLGGKRTYLGLPNNPDYDMAADSGSICDTLGSVGIQQLAVGSQAELFVFYHSSWQKLFINSQHIKGKNCLLQIFDMNGRIIFSAEKKTQPSYFTMDVNCAAFAKGMYVVSLQTEKEKLVKKFVKE
ncbi:MAG: T9SS type A sorting domain-containing protein, partial [Bacteroidota bacterium]